MLKWQTGEPARIKKPHTVILAILALVLVYAIIHACIPASAGNEPLYILHTVEPGDTLHKLIADVQGIREMILRVMQDEQN